MIYWTASVCASVFENRSVKELRSIYVDTTFCVPKAFFIPRREDCIDAAIEVVQDWISRDKDHLILLSYKADIGYERLFVCLSEKFGMKVHFEYFKLWHISILFILSKKKITNWILSTKRYFFSRQSVVLCFSGVTAWSV